MKYKCSIINRENQGFWYIEADSPSEAVETLAEDYELHDWSKVRVHGYGIYDLILRYEAYLWEEEK